MVRPPHAGAFYHSLFEEIESNRIHLASVMGITETRRVNEQKKLDYKAVNGNTSIIVLIQFDWRYHSFGWRYLSFG